MKECDEGGIGVDVPMSAGANDIETLLGLVVVAALQGAWRKGPGVGVVLVPLAETVGEALQDDGGVVLATTSLLAALEEGAEGKLR